MAANGEIIAANGLKTKLLKLGLGRNIDLALHLPLRYEDETSITPIAEAPDGVALQLQVNVLAVSVQYRPRRQLVVRAADASGEITLRFLNFYGSQLKQFELLLDGGKCLRLFGETRSGFFGVEMVHPRYRVVGADEPLPLALTPVYPTTAGVSQSALRRLIAAALNAVDLDDPLDLAPLPLSQAVRMLHTPPPGVIGAQLALEQRPDWRRIKFDELLAQQISLRRAYLTRREQGAPPLKATGAVTSRLLDRLPFSLTGAQQRVWQEIAYDLEQPQPAQRLLQGDVGSGKTVVAALAACQAIEAGYQVALMAPTEILAEQHYAKLCEWLQPLNVEVAWLSGSQTRAAKSTMHRRAATTAQLIVGTHALIQENVDFAALGLAIVDEQHRFGVAQRLSLRQKGCNPHQIMMSATPIPRTLAMSYYADLDVSILDELPPGRRPIRTRLLSDARRDEVIAAMRAAISLGRQAYWVCPLIEESEKLQLQTAQETFATLSTELPDLRIGLVHGRLKAADKAQIMQRFVNGEIDVLVATTVIEVGVDVPNASLMVIEHAERFGLSQLHQLRGRVGRGGYESVCVLLYQTPLSEMARSRLKVIYENTDGFEIARQDLRLRGPGEFVGSRQSGVPMLRYADLEEDADLVEQARPLAEKLLREAPEIAARLIERWLGGREEMLKV